MVFDSLSRPAQFALVGGFALAIAVYAGFRDRRERTRSNLDHISTVPWTLLSALGSMLAIALLAVAAHGWLAPGAG